MEIAFYAFISIIIYFYIFIFSVCVNDVLTICVQGIEFDLAVRKFLATFLLPKEAQQIDRLMEKFAERYYNDNKNETETVFGTLSLPSHTSLLLVLRSFLRIFLFNFNKLKI